MSVAWKGTVDRDLLRPMRRAARRLAQARLRLRGFLLAAGAIWSLGVAAALSAATLLADWLIRFDRPARIVLLAVAALLLVVVVYRRLLRPLGLPLHDLDLAVILDRRQPGLGERLANVLQLPLLLDDPSLASPAMIRAEVLAQARALDETNLGGLFNGRRQLCQVVLSLFLAATPLAAVRWAPDVATIYFRRWLRLEDVRWPQGNYLSVLGVDASGTIRAPRGEGLVLQVDAQPRFAAAAGGWRLEGRETPLTIESAEAPAPRVPDRVQLEARAAGGQVRHGVFTQFENANFRYELPPLVEPLELYLSGGDDWLGPIRVEPIDRPALKSLSLVALPPGKSEPTTLEVGASEQPPQFLATTQLELRGVSNQPLARAEVLSQGGSLSPVEQTGPDAFRYRWTMSEPVALEVRLAGAESGLESKPYFLSVNLQIDREPRVTIRATGVGRRIAPRARIPLSLHVLDDFGVADVALEMEQSIVQDEKPSTVSRELPLPADAAEGDTPPAAPRTEVGRSRVVPLEEFALTPGTTVKLRGVARDNCVLGSHAGKSRFLLFQVVSADELFYEILMRQREQRARFAAALNNAKKQQETLGQPLGEEQLASLARTHQVITRAVWQAANQLEATWHELTLNDLGTQQARDLLQENVVQPMRALHDDALARMREALGQLAAENPPSEAKQAAAAEQAGQVVDQMQKILAQMSQWESFVDVVNQLRQVMLLQEELRKATEEMEEKRTSDLFDE